MPATAMTMATAAMATMMRDEDQGTRRRNMRMGSGAGFSSDRLGPAVDLAEKGALDWLVFETIGERTLAFGHRDRRLDPERGYNPQLGARMRAVLGHCRTNRTRIMTNMGVANVERAAKVVVDVARELGLDGLRVAAVLGTEIALDRIAEVEVGLFSNGVEVGWGVGRDASGHPADGVVWLVERLAARGERLRAGEFVITGGLTVTGMLLGNRIGSIWGKRVEILGGVVLICIGLKILLQAL